MSHKISASQSCLNMHDHALEKNADAETFRQAGLDQAIQSIRARGTLVNIAIWEKTANITPNALCFRERRYMGVATYQEGDYQDVIDAIASG